MEEIRNGDKLLAIVWRDPRRHGEVQAQGILRIAEAMSCHPTCVWSSPRLDAGAPHAGGPARQAHILDRPEETISPVVVASDDRPYRAEIPPSRNRGDVGIRRQKQAIF